jgi:hypothetical protein
MSNHTAYRVEFTDRDMPYFIDMLRYDAATVLTWDRSGLPNQSRWIVTLDSVRFTPARWNSFGLFPKPVI